MGNLLLGRTRAEEDEEGSWALDEHSSHRYIQRQQQVCFSSGSMRSQEGEIKDVMADRIVEAIRSRGPDLARMLAYLNEALEGKEGKTVHGRDLSNEMQLAKDVVNGKVTWCLVQSFRRGGLNAATVAGKSRAEVMIAEAACSWWALDNLLEYVGDSVFFEEAVKAGAVEAAVEVLEEECMHRTMVAASAVGMLRNLMLHYEPSHAVLGCKETRAKAALQKLLGAYACPAPVWVAAMEILTTMGWVQQYSGCGTRSLYSCKPSIAADEARYARIL